MRNTYECVVTNGLVVYPEKTVRADIGIAQGTIKILASPGTIHAKKIVDAGGCYVLPGVVDPHIHPVYLDDMADSSKAGAFGGVTTLIHYAYAKPGQSLAQTIKKYIREGEATSFTDFALHGGLFKTLEQSEEIPEAFKLGVTSFKMFMAYAKLGWMTDDYALVKAMDIIGRMGGMAFVHAENGLAIDYIQDKLLAEKADLAEHFQETSPALAEAEGIFRAVYLGTLMNCPVYIPHISSAEAIEVVRFLKSKGRRIYAETCPQYLTLTWKELKSRGPLGKVGPSIKTKADQDALWRAIQDRIIDSIGSDHAPKSKKIDDDFFQAPYGSPEVETTLPLVWDRGVNTGIITPNDVARLLAENPARIMGLYPKKGRLDTGADADLVVFDPAEPWVISQNNQHSNAPYTLFEGKAILGRVRAVLSKGVLIVTGPQFLGEAGKGEFLPSRTDSAKRR